METKHPVVSLSNETKYQYLPYVNSFALSRNIPPSTKSTYLFHLADAVHQWGCRHES